MAKTSDFSNRTMVKGVAWLTIANIFSRILAAVYIIPWYGWFGDDKLQANALYTKGYTVYAVFLMLSTAGIPAAISKLIAKYNALDKQSTSIRLFRDSVVVMLGIGVIMGGIMWYSAPMLSAGDNRMIPVYQSLSYAVMIIPMMSTMRGFFQGYQDMMPSAISQLMEQLFRILYMLVATYIIMKILRENYVVGIIQSTFAAFIGAVFGSVILVYFLLVRKENYSNLTKKNLLKIDGEDFELIKELFLQAVPFIFVGVATALYAVIDQYTFPVVMRTVTAETTKQIDSMYALFAGNANKLVMIIISLGTAMAMTTLPILSDATSSGKTNVVKKQIYNSMELLFIIIIPCILGMVAIARPIYNIFYGSSSYNELGISVLQISALLSFFQAFFLLFADVLQGVYQNYLAVKYTLYGIVVKILVQGPAVVFFGVYGSLISTAIGMLVSSIFMYSFLKSKYAINLFERLFTVKIVGIAGFTMSIVIYVMNKGYELFLENKFGRVGYVVEVTLLMLIGAYIYIYILTKFYITDKIIGSNQSAKLRSVLKIK